MQERTKLRLRKLYRLSALPPWAVTIWGIASHFSTGQWVLNAFGKTWPYIVLMGGKVQGVFLMLLGLAWLGWLVQRPEKRLAAADLRALNSKRLRNYTVDLTQQIRKFEAEESEKEDAVRLAEHHGFWHGQPDEERRRLWQKQNADSSARRAAHDRDYKTRFHADVMALYDVLKERVGDVENPPFGIPVVIKAGMLAGVYPILDAANYLEKMARRLP